MDENLQFVYEKMLERAAEALRKNHMQTFLAADGQEALQIVQSLLKPGDTVACGGSMTLAECGVSALLANGDYTFLDRDAPGADRRAAELQAYGADVYFASANAVTMDGEIYAIDGNGNRVSAIAYGPKTVVLVVGRNKLVPDVAAARRRNAEISGPANCKRLGKATPCTVTGACIDCHGDSRICSIELVLRGQMHGERIKVILVNEELGY